MPDPFMDLGIIPAPNNISSRNEVSQLSELRLNVSENYNSSYLKFLFESLSSVSWVNTEKANVFIYTDSDLKWDSYRLEIQRDRIEIGINGPVGLQYAMVSLAQIVRHRGFPLPQIRVDDEPKLGYRGMHLDVCRHFFGVEDIKKYLDFLAYYKYNNFHWHLTEDQGWRIEIKKYPKLQEVAAFRKETLLGHYSDMPHQFDGQRYGGYYTQEEIREVIAYAIDRNINIIPEIEMPGHALAALAAYPELGCDDKKYEVATLWGVFEDVFCPKEVTFKFLEDVIDEVVDLFPSPYIHIGGDECPKEVWKNNIYCQELIEKEGLGDENGLQSYFIKRMEKYINSKGRQIIGWDEILEGGLAPNATVMSWRGVEGGLEAARQGNDVIMTPGSHCYFDHYQSDSPNEPLAIGGLTTLEKVYEWEPIPHSLETDKRKHILGGQGNVWTEYISTYSQVEYMAYARGIAMTEVLWSNQKNYSQFVSRFIRHYDYWQKTGAHVAFHVFDLKPRISAGEGQPVNLVFDTLAGGKIVYSFNKGSYKEWDTSQPFQVNQTGKYIFTQEKDSKKSSPVILDFDLHKGTKASIALLRPPSKQYLGNGEGSLINGILGSDTKYSGNEWLGFNGENCEGLLDFGLSTEINEVHFRFFKSEGQWIYLPSKVELWISNDGAHYQKHSEKSIVTSTKKVTELSFDNLDLNMRYIKFRIKNFGEIPNGRQGAGHKAWLFVDEIVIR